MKKLKRTSNAPAPVPAPVPGRRAQKKSETLRRIGEVGLKLFIEKGYEGTTLEEIAAASGISRRTFFSYYKSKDEILMAHQGSGFLEAIYPALIEESTEQTPLDAVKHCLVQLLYRYETKETRAVDRLMRSTEALRARKQVFFLKIEQNILEALCELWPQARRKAALRLVAMASAGAMRVATEAWRQDNGKKPLVKHLQEAFSTLVTEI
jgi:AcrR family transcriptional regulator